MYIVKILLNEKSSHKFLADLQTATFEIVSFAILCWSMKHDILGKTQFNSYDSIKIKELSRYFSDTLNIKQSSAFNNALDELKT